MAYQSRRGNSRSNYTSRRRNNQSKRRGGSSSSYRSRINPDKYINLEPRINEQVNYDSNHTFSDFGLHPQIIKNLNEAGFTEPTAIQDQAIKPITAGRDLVGLANTGTGKTAA